METRQVEVKGRERVVAEMKVQKVRQIAEYVRIAELRDFVLLKVQLY